jgi:hypothetical protein
VKHLLSLAAADNVKGVNTPDGWLRVGIQNMEINLSIFF